MFEERRSLDSKLTRLACSTIGMTPSGETGKRGDCPHPHHPSVTRSKVIGPSALSIPTTCTNRSSSAA